MIKRKANIMIGFMFDIIIIFLFIFFLFYTIINVYKIKEYNNKILYEKYEKTRYLDYLLHYGGTSILKERKEYDVKYNDPDVYKLVSLNNFGLALINEYKYVVPYSVDENKFLILKEFLEKCENKYHLSTLRNGKQANITNDLDQIVEYEYMTCLKLYNFFDGRTGYLMEIECEDNYKNRILIGKPNDVCVEIDNILLQKLDGNRSKCKIKYC